MGARTLLQPQTPMLQLPTHEQLNGQFMPDEMLGVQTPLTPGRLSHQRPALQSGVVGPQVSVLPSVELSQAWAPAVGQVHIVRHEPVPLQL